MLPSKLPHISAQIQRLLSMPSSGTIVPSSFSHRPEVQRCWALRAAHLVMVVASSRPLLLAVETGLLVAESSS